MYRIGMVCALLSPILSLMVIYMRTKRSKPFEFHRAMGIRALIRGDRFAITFVHQFMQRKTFRRRHRLITYTTTQRVFRCPIPRHFATLRVIKSANFLHTVSDQPIPLMHAPIVPLPHFATHPVGALTYRRVAL